jgi:hypothetical protein
MIKKESKGCTDRGQYRFTLMRLWDIMVKVYVVEPFLVSGFIIAKRAVALGATV